MRLLLFLLIFVAVNAHARIGDKSIQFVDRYGAPKDTAQDKHPSRMTGLVEGAIHHTYEYQGWKIRAAFLQVDGPAVRMDYQKIMTAGVNPRIEDYELQAITSANTPAGMSWQRVAYDDPGVTSPNVIARLGEAYFANAIGEKMWQRSDGAILWLRSSLMIRLELPAARGYEAQLKATKEQKARASVPSF